MRASPRNRPAMWAIRVGEFVELYDLNPIDCDAILLADFLVADFEKYCGYFVPEDGPHRLHLKATNDGRLRSGFAGMSPERRQTLAAQGGRTTAARGKAPQHFTRDTATAAGRRSGYVRRRKA